MHAIREIRAGRAADHPRTHPRAHPRTRSGPADRPVLWVCAGAVVAGVAYETAKSVPDLRRYLRMRRM
ncbi:DUF6893 family small protein [Streptomyces sp. NPDC056244]|uniref:DUF6893 family small protein n=1 Tax=unclassified Streptomyces TaxID=2593676 RepID=UPI0035D9BC7B